MVYYALINAILRSEYTLQDIELSRKSEIQMIIWGWSYNDIYRQKILNAFGKDIRAF